MGSCQGGSESRGAQSELFRGIHGFFDDLALTREDPQASGEQRFVSLGLSDTGNLLVVVYTYRKADILRVISAWKANRRQRLEYERNHP